MKRALKWIERGIDYDLDCGRPTICEFLQTVSPFDSVVDIGAGRGHDLSTAKKFSGNAILTGLDSNSERVRGLKDQGFNAFLMSIEKDKYPFASESIDVFIANQVLEHTKEIYFIFHEVTRCLRVGGHFIVGIPNIASLHNRFLLLMGIQPTQARNYGEHVRAFTKNDFVNFLSRVWPGGYEIESFRGSQFYPFPGFMARRLSLFLPNCSFCIYFLLRKTKKYYREFLDYPVTQGMGHQFYLGGTAEDEYSK
ncbi:MAG: class I SAM-dependent methyltransferase [Desulfobaccales bacterium]